ncbi:hypothetical protein EWM64_g9427 [Hericium alpestre]|uniref:Uncharacterized protein n=1 Tax=Hericium alpestre TaxID=135208 RepID=A0A4Y9ZJF6_9AGAM|nr:hypothetical protein EWM64_g9427 [Hericium alpestre]
MPGLLNISFALGEMSKSAVWSDVKTSIAQRMKSSLKELEIATEVRIPDNMGIVRWLSDPSDEPLGACFPLLVTELKPLGVMALRPAGARVIQKTLHQVSWQAALAMEMFGERNVWTLICAGQWACFQYWTADGMKPIPNGPLPSKQDAGEADETSDVIPIYDDTHTDFSDAYKAWMNRVIGTARAATLTHERAERQRQALSQFV